MYNQYLSAQSMASLEFSRMVLAEINKLPDCHAEADMINFLLGLGQ